MGPGDGSEGEYRSPAHDDFDTEVYVDAADRLERAMDTQIQILEGIDNKAEHVTRLIALLLGILFSVISFVTQLRQTPFAPPPSTVLVTFGIGVGSLLVSMGAAIVTYLSSQYKIGLDDDVGQFLSDASVSTDLPEHVRSVLGSYAFVTGQNQQGIEANVFWFRLTLLFLLYGISFVSSSGFLYVGDVRESIPLNGTLVVSALSAGIGYYVLSGSSFYRFRTKTRPMSEETKKKSISETDAVVETEHGTRYRALRSGKAGKPRSDRVSPLRWLRNALSR